MTELKCYVIAHGIKKRCRKVSREMIKMQNRPLGTTVDDIRALALSLVNDTMKVVTSATIHLDIVEVEQCEGYQTESWKMFDDRHKKHILIEKVAA